MNRAKRQTITRIDLRSQAFKAAPEKTWAKLHANGPVLTTHIPLLGRVALTTRYAESHIVLRDSERFTVDATLLGHKQSAGMKWWVPSMLSPLANNLLTLEGDEHRALRQRVDYAFRRVRLEQLKPVIDGIALQRVTELQDRLERDAQADFVSLVARPMPQHVISQLLGFHTLSPAAHKKLDKALSRLGSIRHGWDLFRTIPAIGTISRQLREHIEHRRQNPNEALISELLSDIGNGRALTDDELLSMIFLLYVAGHETTTHFMSLAVATLLKGSAPYNGSLSDGRKQLPLDYRKASELLRYTSPVQMTKPRFALHDQQLGNAWIKRGETVAVLTGAVNYDEGWIEDPQTLNLERQTVKHLGFGTGPHACLGMQLALTETCTLVNTLFDRIPTIALAPTNAITWNNRIGLRAVQSLKVTH